MSNDQGSDSYWNETAQEVYSDAEANKTFTREERATLDLSDRLKHEHEQAQPDLGATLWTDLLGAAMSEVNWYEIAEHYVADVDKDKPETEAKS